MELFIKTNNVSLNGIADEALIAANRNLEVLNNRYHEFENFLRPKIFVVNNVDMDPKSHWVCDIVYEEEATDLMYEINHYHNETEI